MKINKQFSFEAQPLGLNKVVTAKGGKTAGTDEVVRKGPREYWLAIKELGNTINNHKEYRAEPVRRV